MSSNLRNLKTLRDLSEKVIKRVKFNFVRSEIRVPRDSSEVGKGWALMYNLLAVPIAAGAIYPAKRARLNPVWASLAMGLS
jgi:Cu+-exporting ATPase